MKKRYVFMFVCYYFRGDESKELLQREGVREFRARFRLVTQLCRRYTHQDLQHVGF